MKLEHRERFWWHAHVSPATERRVNQHLDGYNFKFGAIFAKNPRVGERRPRDVCTVSPKCVLDVGTEGFEGGFDADKIVEDDLV
jgi:hypothetical protein